MSDRTGFAVPELLVTCAVLPAAVCVAFVATSGLDESSGISVSQSNLVTLGAAHELYAAEHGGRVFSLSPDDYGAFEGCVDYIENRGCLDSLVLGWGESVTGNCQCDVQWGYWIGGTSEVDCAFGSCGNAVLITPMDFQQKFGSFRVPNCERFHQYVNGRFYDATYYAPLDTLTYEGAAPFFDECCGFTTGEGSFHFSSYAFSPSSMWDPGVMRSEADGGFQAPGSYDESHRAPTVSRAAHPELKTLLFEHNWNHGQPGAFNPAFEGERTPYQFNHGRDATPLTCFLDGSVRMLRTGNAAADDARLREQTGMDGIWHQGTPLGTSGYHLDQSHDDVRVAHNVLTTDGIRGRDILSTSMRDADTNGDGRVDGEDLFGVLGAWGVDVGWNSPHDIDADGLVGGFDLNAILGEWTD